MKAKLEAILIILTAVSCTDYSEQRDCGSLQIAVSDALMMSPETVKAVIGKEYGCCIGQNLDSLDLGAIESVLDSCAVVKKAQAWTTHDGVLHIRVNTRVPAVRLSKGNIELFCDRSGYLFPVGNCPSGDIRRISGDIPLKMKKTMHGNAATEWQRKWLQGVMDVSAHGFDGEIAVTAGGELRLTPRDGKEVYLFGFPDGIEVKFSKIETYLGRIRPLQEYSSVNLKYKGQIICRNDI